MSTLTLPGLAEAIAAAVASVSAVCLAVCRYVDEPDPRPGETRLFIDTSLLPESSLLRVAPVPLAAETRHRANGPMPAELGPDTPRSYWPDWAPYPARHRLTTTEANHR